MNALKNGKSGIKYSLEMKNKGLKSHVWGALDVDSNFFLERKFYKFFNQASLYAYLSMKSAILDSQLNENIYSKNPRVGLILGSGIGSGCFFRKNFTIFDLICQKKNFLNSYLLLKNMPSSISAILGCIFKIFGVNYSISSACTTSINCIGQAKNLISFGQQDIIFAGGSEELNVEIAAQFDSLNILTKKFNHIPIQSSRPYDIQRDGFVISGGSGILVLEERNHAIKRNAKIYAEIIGYGTTCDGKSMTKPNGDGIKRCMKIALKEANTSIDYINTHGTSTKIGDLIELRSIKEIFHDNFPYISSTKSITGHSLGSSGVHEIIYILLMFRNGFIAPSINISKLESYAKNMNIVQFSIEKNISVAMSNNLGFGGTNSSIILKKYNFF